MTDLSCSVCFTDIWIRADTYGIEVAQNALDVILYHLNYTHGWPFGSHCIPEDAKAPFTIHHPYETILKELWQIVVHLPRSALHNVIPFG
jgi:hypothetical protein